eukprot:TRINITY_DN13589_c0_g2_i1.p2 TRINITY_DN13589_c0_g2~~TRINITY_DN13589_c0_g2_i1.p2  ORF type:complete len:100 (+),score=9.00 TRINITY_DN13589_c0_g2_i1:817-1116(+)
MFRAYEVRRPCNTKPSCERIIKHRKHFGSYDFKFLKEGLLAAFSQSLGPGQCVAVARGNGRINHEVDMEMFCGTPLHSFPSLSILHILLFESNRRLFCQ